MNPLTRMSAATLFALSNLSAQTGRVSRAQEQLASGMRINRSGDDPVGMTLVQRADNKLIAAQQGWQNTQDGISLLNIAEGAMFTLSDSMMRMRDLTLQAANGTNGQEQRDAIAKELAQLTAEIERIANTTTFNKRNLLNVTNPAMVIQLGSGTEGQGQRVNLSNALGDARPEALGILNGTAGFTAITDIWDPATETTQLTNPTVAQNFINDLDAALKTLNDWRANMGAHLNRLETHSENLIETMETDSRGRGRIRDADIAQQSSKMVQEEIRRQASASILTQTYRLNELARSLVMK